MFKNYFKIAIRNMLKDKFYTFINISGLTIGIAGTLFVVLYVWNELSYDKFHDNYEELYHIALTGKIADQEINSSTTSPPIGPALVANVPGVESSVRVNPNSQPILRYEDKAFSEKKIVYADSNFFEFFSFKLINGDPSQVLQEPNSAVLTETLALKYFGEEDPVGKIIQLGNEKSAYKITGICEDAPANSHLQFSAVMSMSSLYDDYSPQFWQNWLSNSWQTYIRKNPSTSVDEVNAKLKELTKENAGPILEQVLGIPFDEMLAAGGMYGYWIYPVTDIRLHSKLDHYPTPTGDITYVYIFGAIGIFLLVIACINFMNLSTAKSAGRAKEVGLRKTLGSSKARMIGQFLSESIVYSLISGILSLGIVFALLPQFNELAGVELSFQPLLSFQFLLIMVGIILLVGILAGSYPSFFLTRFSIVDVLKGTGMSNLKSGNVRRGLVVFQFMISISLIICTGAVYNQLKFVSEKNLGFDKDHILVVNQANRLGNNKIGFKNSLDKIPSIQQTSFTNNYFPGVNNTTVFKTAGTEQDFIMGFYYADWDHLDAMGYTLEEGRFFDRDFPSDTLAIIINESAAKLLNFESALNEELIYFGNNNFTNYKIVGVLKDFNFESLKTEVRPIAIGLTKEANNMIVRYEGSSQDLINSLESEWNKLSNGEPFDYTFLDQEYDALFKEEQRLGELFTVLSVLAIFIACLGLFGLASFMAEQRVKEIGIRKAMGASIFNLAGLLSKEFIILIIVAFTLAVYPSWYFMNEWLNGFAFHIPLSWTLFAFAGIISLGLAWVTVTYQAIKAARANPVDSLRYE